MSDKTEAPTPSRIHEAREEGRVARSIELNTAAMMLISVLLLRGPGTTLVQVLKDLMVHLLITLPSVKINEGWLTQTLVSALLQVLPSFGLILVGLLFTGAAVTMGQTGFLWTSKRMGFDFKRVNPLNGLKRIFSKNGLVELLRSLLKLIVVGGVAYGFLNSNYPALLVLNQSDLASGLQQFLDLAIALAMRIGMAYLILGVVDYVYQRWDLMRNMRMSKQEVKEEIKRSEGDPFYKSYIRNQQRRMARSRMMANVPKATVIVTNPTHLALAIEYSGDMNAPRLLAKGAHKVAQRIVALARENGIPIVQNIPLAHAIYDNVEIDHEITADLYMAMAEVLAYVYRMHGKSSPTRAAAQPTLR